MWRSYEILQSEERVAARRLDSKNVECRAAQPAVFQSILQCLLVDNVAARNVD